MFRALALGLLIALSVILSGCISSGAQFAQHATYVELNRSNYRIVARDVMGQSEISYILGLSIPRAFLVSTIGVFKLNGETSLFGDAVANLWDNYAATHGAVEGRSLALTNLRYDNDAMNLLFYTKARLTIHADIVEFAE